jgi:hypothetical protein
MKRRSNLPPIRTNVQIFLAVGYVLGGNELTGGARFVNARHWRCLWCSVQRLGIVNRALGNSLYGFS